MATIRFLFVDDDTSRCMRMSSTVRSLNAKLGEENVIVLDVVNSAAEALSALRGETHRPYMHGPGDRLYDVCSLDHDMAPEHYEHLSVGKPGDGTGMDVARFLAENMDLCPSHVNVHSWNPDGSKSMAYTVFNSNASDGHPVSVYIEKFPGVSWLTKALKDLGITIEGL